MARYTVTMSEVVHYEFEIEVPDEELEDHDSSQRREALEEAAEDHFTAHGPNPTWFTHCEEREVLSVKKIKEAA